MSIVVTKMPKKIERRVLISTATLAVGLGFSLAGPSQVLNFPDSFIMMTIGWNLVYNLQAFWFIPLLPEITDSVAGLYHKSHHEKVNNMCSGLFNTCINLGTAFGSLIGAYLNERIGYRYTVDVVGASIFLFGLIYFYLTNSA